MFSYAMFQGGFVSWFLFFSFAPIFLYSTCLFFYPLGDFMFERTFNQEEFQAGSNLDGTIQMKRKLPFPIFYLIVEEEVSVEWKKRGIVKQPKTIVFPWFKREISFHYTLQELPRGEHLFQGVRIKTGDLFGLIEKERYVRLERTILVYPKVVEMSGKKQEKASAYGQYVNRNPLMKDTSMAVSVRDYEPGDKLSWVDWKATARRNKLMTKEFDPTYRGGHVVVMDETASESFESMITFTASFVQALLRTGEELTFYSLGSSTAVFYPEFREQQLQKIFLYLAKVNEKEKVEFLVPNEHEEKQGESVTIITSTISPALIEWIEQTFYRQKHPVKVIVIFRSANELTNDEMEKVQKLKKSHVSIQLVFENMFSDWLSRGGFK